MMLPRRIPHAPIAASSLTRAAGADKAFLTNDTGWSAVIAWTTAVTKVFRLRCADAIDTVSGPQGCRTIA
jgi:hypothetical protein